MDELSILQPYVEYGENIVLDSQRQAKPRRKGVATDLRGQRFGLLTAIEPTEQRVRGRVVWRCHCDCGGEVLAPTDQLRSGYRRSCGCLSHPPLKDLIGKRFGRLVVIDYDGKRGGMHRWKCRCDCGNITSVGQTLLQTGKTQSCDCLSSERFLERRGLTEGTSIKTLEYFKYNLSHANTSGCNGVYKHKKSGMWAAQITFKGKTKYLGIFKSKDEAILARRKAEVEIEEFLEEYYRNNPEWKHPSEREQNGNKQSTQDVRRKKR